MNALQQENSRLRNDISSLNTQNAQLKTEVVYLKGVVNNSGLSKLLNNGAALFTKLSQQPGATASPASSTSHSPHGSPHPTGLSSRSAGVVLLVMLFSFGLMFNTQPGFPNPLGGSPLSSRYISVPFYHLSGHVMLSCVSNELLPS